MDDQILKSLKTSLNIQQDDTAFDDEIINAVPAVIGILDQAGAIPAVYEITSSTTFKDLYGGIKPKVVAMIKAYMSIYIRRVFDPATSSFLHNTLKAREDELLWRIIQGIEYDY